ncbi:YheC/YheD family protein [Risungbinella massiliensis]|uniref:YheC/YheD family protein n=1 Tax=Risungbinella massiliensis TaxID=1329796 RepID=UPI0005CC469F|nr:YheC/YheD family protein [Risungbinella massiliensis]
MGSVMSKLSNDALLQKDKKIALSLPRTLPYSIQNLRLMLLHYSNIYLKPDNSCQGKGAMRIDKHPDDHYLLRSRDTKKIYIFKKLAPLHQHIQRIKMKRPYLLQQGIVSQTPSGNMVDIRVHLFRLNHVWKQVAMAARVAPTQNVVTNRSSGGEPIDLDELLTSHLGYTTTEVEQKKEELSYLATRAVQRISAKHPSYSEFGVDIGIDLNGDLWIYEVNIRPSLRMFRQIDYKLYQHLLRLRKQVQAKESQVLYQ